MSGFSISFAVDVEAFVAELTDIERRIMPSVTRNALNSTLKDVLDAERLELTSVFDRPKPFTSKSLLYTEAKKENLEAVFFVRDQAAGGTPPARYLQAQVEGGGRKAKPFERQLRSAGILGAAEFAVPARGQALDAYGNIPLRTIRTIIGQVVSAGPRKPRKAGSRAAQYFMPAEGGRLPRGVFERRGKSIRAVLIFVPASAGYSRRYGFADTLQTIAPAAFERHFVRWFDHLTAQRPVMNISIRAVGDNG